MEADELDHDSDDDDDAEASNSFAQLGRDAVHFSPMEPLLLCILTHPFRLLLVQGQAAGAAGAVSMQLSARTLALRAAQDRIAMTRRRLWAMMSPLAVWLALVALVWLLQYYWISSAEERVLGEQVAVVRARWQAGGCTDVTSCRQSMPANHPCPPDSLTVAADRPPFCRPECQRAPVYLQCTVCGSFGCTAPVICAAAAQGMAPLPAQHPAPTQRSLCPACALAGPHAVPASLPTS